MITTENKTVSILLRTTLDEFETAVIGSPEKITTGLGESPDIKDEEIFSIGMGFTVSVTNYKK